MLLWGNLAPLMHVRSVGWQSAKAVFFEVNFWQIFVKRVHQRRATPPGRRSRPKEYSARSS